MGYRSHWAPASLQWFVAVYLPNGNGSAVLEVSLPLSLPGSLFISHLHFGGRKDPDSDSAHRDRCRANRPRLQPRGASWWKPPIWFVSLWKGSKCSCSLQEQIILDAHHPRCRSIRSSLFPTQAHGGALGLLDSSLADTLCRMSSG